MKQIPGFTSVVSGPGAAMGGRGVAGAPPAIGGRLPVMGMANGGKVKKGKKAPPFGKKMPAKPNLPPMMPGMGAGYKDGGKAKKGKC